MYKVTNTLEFTHNVPVMVPADGGHVEQSMKVRFRTLPSKETDALDPASDDAMKDILTCIIVSIDDVVGEDDQPLPYSDALRDQLLVLPFVRLAIWRAYVAAVTRAKAGN